MGFFDEELDDLFNDWERRMREEREKMKNKGDMEGLFNMLNFDTNMKGMEDFDKVNELGEPDSIEEFEESGMKFIRKTWKTEEGEYVLVESVGRIDGSDMEDVISALRNGPFKEPELTLEEQLEEAIEEEEYEKAAELRDKIKEKEINDELFSDKKGSKLK